MWSEYYYELITSVTLAVQSIYKYATDTRYFHGWGVFSRLSEASYGPSLPLRGPLSTGINKGF